VLLSISPLLPLPRFLPCPLTVEQANERGADVTLGELYEFGGLVLEGIPLGFGLALAVPV